MSRKICYELQERTFAFAPGLFESHKVTAFPHTVSNERYMEKSRQQRSKGITNFERVVTKNILDYKELKRLLFYIS